MMKTLILNADDFGMTRGINDGVIRAHREGILTSATLMATGFAFEDAVAKAKANPTLGVGCHLVLTGGMALMPREKLPSLVDKRGKFPESLTAFVAKVSSGAIRTEEIELELRAQIQKIRSAGIEPTHVDTHKHTHAHPRVMHAVGRVASDLKIRCVRKPVEDLCDSWSSLRGGQHSLAQVAGAVAVRLVSSRFQSIAHKYALSSPDYFLGLATTGRLGTDALSQLIGRVREGSTEIMLHPGFCDADLQAYGERLQEQRQNELDALLAPESRRTVRERGIQLISYRELG
jgi:chitin disaccharide deacetylase